MTKISHFVNSKVPSNTSLNIPFITTEQVSTFIIRLNSFKAMGLDGIGPGLLKLSEIVYHHQLLRLSMN